MTQQLQSSCGCTKRREAVSAPHPAISLSNPNIDFQAVAKQLRLYERERSDRRFISKKKGLIS
jgi:hypothetical protein